MIMLYILLFLGLLLFGTPIYLSMGIPPIVQYVLEGNLLPPVQIILDKLNSDTLVAVPYFVVAAYVMERGRIAEILIDAARVWLGGLYGGVGIVAVAACAVFAAMCGSSVATAIAMSTILLPAMAKDRYETGFASGIVATSGTLGILIPPSLAFVVYGIIAEVSIPRLFLAGMIPGLLQAALLIGFIYLQGRRRNYINKNSVPMVDRLRVTGRALPALAIPFIVLGGLYSGILSLTESAALAALTALFLSLFVYKTLGWNQIFPVTTDAIKSAATILIIIVGAASFGQLITQSGIANALVDLVAKAGLSSWQVLLAINVIVLIMGMFLEAYSIILITLPIILPLLTALDIDLIHFGVLFTINLEIGLITPPVGLNLFVISSVSRTPLGTVIRGTLPFFGLMLVLLMVITYVPSISLWLPSLWKG
ncbi:MAG: TRAP transporter large permease [Bacteroidales bacterium]|nr:TRAP transporter large permease [Bacteroidales bacterium]